MKKFDSKEPSPLVKKVESGKLRRKGIVLLISIGLFWGMAWPAIKISVSELQPWTFRTYCLVLGGIGILILAKANGFSLRIPLTQLKPLCLISLLNITGWHIFSAHGVLRMNAGRASIIAFTMPLWATIISAFILNERITRIRILALGLGIVGLAFLIWPEIEAVGATPVGSMFMLGAALSWATGTVLLKRLNWSMPTTVLTGWQLILGSIPVVIGSLVLEQVTVIFKASASAVLALSYIIAIPMIFCHWAYFTLVRIFPASVAAISTLAIPVVGVFSSALILNEPVGSKEIVALFLVVTALAMVILIDQKS